MLFNKAKRNLRILLFSTLILLFSGNSFAGKYAVVVSCRSGNSITHKINIANSRQLIRNLEKRGFDKIKLFFDGGSSELKNSDDIIREHIVKYLSGLSKTLKPEDQFYLFLFGHASASPRRFSLATKQGRISGWQILPDHYDDGGFSGGNTERLALTLKRLMTDIEAGKIDILVVYKMECVFPVPCWIS
jgi:hypothetical protein